MGKNEDLWKDIITDLEKYISNLSIDTWFSTARISEIKGDLIVLEFTTEHETRHVQKRYDHMIKDSIKNVTGLDYKLDYQVGEDNSRTNGHGLGQRKTKLNLNPSFTFDNFVVGKSNQFSHAASVSVAESPGDQFNPLFIYGSSGLGKTHLMQAIGNQVVENNPSMRPVYVTSEQFTNEMVDSIRTDTTLNFREKYRNVDLLLIDDIQFLIGKEGTQEEFFHTFNELYQNKKQIVVTSDKPPKDLKGLESRLITRLGGGLITDIMSPDLETRIAILRNKNDREGFEVPDDVLYFIAENIDSNIRELEAALIRVRAFSNLVGDSQPISVSFSRHALKDLIGEEKTISVDQDRVKHIVSSNMGVTIDELESTRRTKKIAYARQVAMYLCRKILDLSLPSIGSEFGGRHHSTVIHGIKVIEKQMANEPGVKDLIEDLENQIKYG